LTPADIAQLDAYLSLHGFGLLRLRPALDGAETTVEAIAARLEGIAPSYASRAELENFVRRRHSALVLDALMNPHIRIEPPQPYLVSTPQPPQQAAQGGPAEQLVFAGAGSFGWHLNLVGPPSTSSDVTMQFQVGSNVPHHPEGKSGREELRFIQFSYNVTTGAVQVTAGLQETYVVSLFHGVLQLAAFAQALAGVATGAATATGWGNVAQVAAGGQVMVQLGPVQFGVQAGPSVTFATGQAPTLDFSVAPGSQATASQGGAFLRITF
jgi:hypothetical protein